MLSTASRARGICDETTPQKPDGAIGHDERLRQGKREVASCLAKLIAAFQML
jgi:hypothetical protein